MRIVDLFAGLEGWGGPHRAAHDVVTVDLDPRFGSDITADVLEPDLGARVVERLGGRPDLVLASPPCEAFSVLAMRHYWRPGREPAHDGTRLAIRLVERTRELIDEWAAPFYVIENPRAMLRKLAPLADLERRTVTYCTFGEPFQKPTDLWGGFPPSLELPRPCKAGDPCHVAAPRGSRTGIQGDGVLVWGWGAATGSGSASRRDAAAIRAKVPEALSRLVVEAAERDLTAGRRPARVTLF